ncbi:hypothetical protein CL622_04915 [archaeon]|nr:hypothetical protein [archaeon]|tara:strand:- start:485 stop:1489 length:1005 start_codon:yes stop_codon:yes gene_type:complete
MRVAILTANHIDKLRDVGDIHAHALHKHLTDSGHETDIIYLYSNLKSTNAVPIYKAIFKSYDFIYASSPKRLYAILCLFFSLVKFKNLNLSVFDSTLEPITSSSTAKMIFKFLYKNSLIRFISASKYQQKYIKKSLGINTPILYPCLLTFGYNKRSKTSTKTILFAGSTNNKKRGLDTILKAVSILRKKYPHIKIRILNKFKSSERWAEITPLLIRKYKLHNNVEQIGYVKHMANEYKKASVYVLPFNTTKYIPPLPFTMLEAMSFSVPVISSKIEAFREILPLENTIAPGDYKTLSTKISFILSKNMSVSLPKQFFPKETAKRFVELIGLKQK